MYDIIGDIHGHATELIQLLKKLNYKPDANGTYRHPSRKVIFVGDFIDRGPEVRRVLQIVKAMTEAGTALAVMGNHEYNILCFHTQDAKGNYLRPHSPNNKRQIATTLADFKDYPDEWKMYLEWMMQLPVFLDLEELRIVHACWQPEMVAYVRQELKGNQLTDEFLQASAVKESRAYEAIETLLKGIERELPDGQTFADKDGHPRSSMRVKWWENPVGATFKNYGIGADFKDEAIPAELEEGFYYKSDDVPVFIGHYWLSQEQPTLRSQSVCCTDFSVAKGGKLVAYRWEKGEILSDDNFVWVSSEVSKKVKCT